MKYIKYLGTYLYKTLKNAISYRIGQVDPLPQVEDVPEPQLP